MPAKSCSVSDRLRPCHSSHALWRLCAADSFGLLAAPTSLLNVSVSASWQSNSVWVLPCMRRFEFDSCCNMLQFTSFQFISFDNAFNLLGTSDGGQPSFLILSLGFRLLQFTLSQHSLSLQTWSNTLVYQRLNCVEWLACRAAVTTISSPHIATSSSHSVDSSWLQAMRFSLQCWDMWL